MIKPFMKRQSFKLWKTLFILHAHLLHSKVRVETLIWTVTLKRSSQSNAR